MLMSMSYHLDSLLAHVISAAAAVAVGRTVISGYVDQTAALAAATKAHHRPDAWATMVRSH